VTIAGVTIVVIDAIVDGVFGDVPGLAASSIGDPGEARGSTKSSNPLGVGNLFNSSLSSL
jgi:hypothetical protein